MANPVEVTSFKYVTIEQDDDELVIEAGSGMSDAATSAPGSSGIAVSDNDAARHEHDLEEDSQAAPANSQADAGKQPSIEKPAEKAEGSYRETTLDDLAREPMPKMQRAVLLGIAVLVIVFVAYVLFF